MARENERAVISGLLALVLVAVLVGGVVAGGVLLFSQNLGLVGDGAVSVAEEATDQDSLYLPTPESTSPATGPLLTLGAQGSGSSGGEGKKPEQQQSTKKPEKQISLSAGQNSVSAMGRIDLTGTYRGGEGSVLQVQRFEDGEWEDFPVTASVRDGTFSTYVQTGRTGKNRFRVADTDSDRVSDAVRVTVR